MKYIVYIIVFFSFFFPKEIEAKNINTFIEEKLALEYAQGALANTSLWTDLDVNRLARFREVYMDFDGSKGDSDAATEINTAKNLTLTLWKETAEDWAWLSSLQIATGLGSELQANTHFYDFDRWAPVDDVVYGGLDVVGLIPGIDTFTDPIGAVYATARGDGTNAVIYTASFAVPFAGAAYIKGGAAATKQLDELYGIVAKQANNTQGYTLEAKKLSEITADEFHVSSVIHSGDEKLINKALQDADNYVDGNTVRRQLDELAKAGGGLLTKLDNLGLSSLITKLDNIGSFSKTEFLDEFAGASDDALIALNNRTDLIDYWKTNGSIIKNKSYPNVGHRPWATTRQEFLQALNYASTFLGIYGSSRILFTKGSGYLAKAIAFTELANLTMGVYMQNEANVNYIRSIGSEGEWFVNNWTTISIATDLTTFSTSFLTNLTRNTAKVSQKLRLKGAAQEADELNELVKAANAAKTGKLDAVFTSARQYVRNKYGQEVLNNLAVKFKLDDGAAAVIVQKWGDEGLDILNNPLVRGLDDVARELLKNKTAYRHISSDVFYLDDLKSTGKIPQNANKTYFSLDKYDDPIVAIDKMQLNVEATDAIWRLEFETNQIINSSSFPKGKWNNANYFEVTTRSYPDFGSGGASQFITQSEINLKRMVNLQTGEVINF